MQEKYILNDKDIKLMNVLEYKNKWKIAIFIVLLMVSPAIIVVCYALSNESDFEFVVMFLSIVFVIFIFFLFSNTFSLEAYFVKNFLHKALKDKGFYKMKSNRFIIKNIIINLMGDVKRDSANTSSLRVIDSIQDTQMLQECYAGKDMNIYLVGASTLVYIRASTDFRLHIVKQEEESTMAFMPKLHFDNTEFNLTYNVYSDDKIGAFRVLTPDFIEKLIIKQDKLYSDKLCTMRLYYEHEGLYVLFDDTIVGFKGNIPIDEYMVINHLKHFEYYLELLMFLKEKSATLTSNDVLNDYFNRDF